GVFGGDVFGARGKCDLGARREASPDSAPYNDAKCDLGAGREASPDSAPYNGAKCDLGAGREASPDSAPYKGAECDLGAGAVPNAQLFRFGRACGSNLPAPREETRT